LKILSKSIEVILKSINGATYRFCSARVYGSGYEIKITIISVEGGNIELWQHESQIIKGCYSKCRETEVTKFTNLNRFCDQSYGIEGKILEKIDLFRYLGRPLFIYATCEKARL
jgi:hypothetical protein